MDRYRYPSPTVPQWETKPPDDPVLPKGRWRITFSGLKDAEVLHDAYVRVVDGTLFIETKDNVTVYASGRWLQAHMDKN